MIALIAGTGYYDIPGLVDRAERPVDTPYGAVTLLTGSWHDQPVAFLARHGADHSIPPSAIDYRANLWALSEAGAEAILAVNVVGSLVEDRGPGAFFLVEDYLEFTSGRADTFFDQPGEVRHTDMTTAYDPELRGLLARAAELEGIDLTPGAVYVCTNGPRFETPAEIRMFATLGAHVVGMTGYPEVALARELALPYAAVAVVANLAAGMSGEELSHEEIGEVLVDTRAPLFALLGRAIRLRAERA